MKFVFIIILLFHGIIHCLGFLKGFQLAEIKQLSQSISKPLGMLWLFTALLFLLAAALYFIKKEWWFFITIPAAIISQILIIIYWKDAKFGTLANVIILLVGISAYTKYRINNIVTHETKDLLQSIDLKDTSVITKNDIQNLPEIVKKWIYGYGVVGKEKIVSVRLKQKGKMKIKPEGKWMHFTAEQYFDVVHPAFVWTTEVDFMPIVKMVGWDKFTNGKGEMHIKLANVIPVVNESNNDKINASAMVRYMAEMVWFPSAAINEYMTWEAIDINSAKAKFTINGERVSGIYGFSNDGNFLYFEADRFYGGEKDSKLEKWKVMALDHKEFNGIKIPNKCSVTWKLKAGDFNWLNLEITDLEYNTNEIYEYNHL